MGCETKSKSRGLSLLSGGLDSQLAVRVLERAGAYVEGVTFATPFFSPVAAQKAAAALGVTLHVIDFTADEIALIENPPHGFGGAMNPCIDCHATMIRRAGELMREKGFDFVATGEVMGQRPMSQNRQSLGIVGKSSGMEGRLVRPLSAQLLAPTIPETEGKLDRTKLLAIQGRCRDPQIKLAAEFGIVDYPSPAGGCKLTEEGFGHKLKDLLEHEGLKDRRLVELLLVGRHFRLPDGTGLIVGRDKGENALLCDEARFAAVAGAVAPSPQSDTLALGAGAPSPQSDTLALGAGAPSLQSDTLALGAGAPSPPQLQHDLIESVDLPGPTALLIGGARSPADRALAERIVAAYTKGSGVTDRTFFKPYHIC